MVGTGLNFIISLEIFLLAVNFNTIFPSYRRAPRQEIFKGPAHESDKKICWISCNSFIPPLLTTTTSPSLFCIISIGTT